MRAGPLDRLIDIERKSVTLDDYGDPQETWDAIVEDCPASYRALKGDERFAAAQYIAKQQIEFRVRYSPDLASLTQLDRVVYPASSVRPQDVYDIISVQPLGVREGIRIVATRRPEISVHIFDTEGTWFGTSYFGSGYLGSYAGKL